MRGGVAKLRRDRDEGVEKSCDCGRSRVDLRVVVLVPARPAFHQYKSGRTDASGARRSGDCRADRVGNVLHDSASDIGHGDDL